jgi:hypothetical protein
VDPDQDNGGGGIFNGHRLNCNNGYLKINQNEFIFNINKIRDSHHQNFLCKFKLNI